MLSKANTHNNKTTHYHTVLPLRTTPMMSRYKFLPCIVDDPTMLSDGSDGSDDSESDSESDMLEAAIKRQALMPQVCSQSKQSKRPRAPPEAALLAPVVAPFASSSSSIPSSSLSSLSAAAAPHASASHASTSHAPRSCVDSVDSVDCVAEIDGVMEQLRAGLEDLKTRLGEIARASVWAAAWGQIKAPVDELKRISRRLKLAANGQAPAPAAPAPLAPPAPPSAPPSASLTLRASAFLAPPTLPDPLLVALSAIRQKLQQLPDMRGVRAARERGETVRVAAGIDPGGRGTRSADGSNTGVALHVRSGSRSTILGFSIAPLGSTRTLKVDYMTAVLRLLLTEVAGPADVAFIEPFHTTHGGGFDATMLNMMMRFSGERACEELNISYHYVRPDTWQAKNCIDIKAEMEEVVAKGKVRESIKKRKIFDLALAALGLPPDPEDEASQTASSYHDAIDAMCIMMSGSAGGYGRGWKAKQPRIAPAARLCKRSDLSLFSI